MLKVKNVAIGTEKYGDAYECTVTFQVGDQSYNTVPVKLTPEATRDVIEMAINRATAMLRVESSEIKIAGEPLPMVGEAPEFAEVEEAPALIPSPFFPEEPAPVGVAAAQEII